MKILFTVSTYKPHIDGIQFVTTYLAEGLVQKGHSVDLISYAFPNLTDKTEEDINGVHVIRRSVSTVHMRHRGDKEAYQRFILENQSNYDVMINVGTQIAYTDWLLPIMDKIHIPKILHLHSIWGFKFHETDFNTIKAFAAKFLGNIRWGSYFLRYKKAFRQYDAVLQLHNKDYSYAFFKNKYDIDCLVLENAAEEQFFQIDNIEKEKLIINVSNYGKMKNQIDCVKVFAKSNIPQDWKLVLVGSSETEYYKQLKEYCDMNLSQEQRKRVILNVGLSREQVINLVKRSSIYLTTSLREAFPISLLEAMAAEVPFISSDVGIVKYLGGGIVAYSQDDYIKNLERLATDEKYRKTLGEAGRKEACEKYRISKKVDRLEKLIYSITSKE